jgi:hypothetical protein
VGENVYHDAVMFMSFVPNEALEKVLYDGCENLRRQPQEFKRSIPPALKSKIWT